MDQVIKSSNYHITLQVNCISPPYVNQVFLVVVVRVQQQFFFFNATDYKNQSIFWLISRWLIFQFWKFAFIVVLLMGGNRLICIFIFYANEATFFSVLQKYNLLLGERNNNRFLLMKDLILFLFFF